MLDELVRRTTLLERRLDNLNLPEKSLLLAAPFMQLPMLRGLWVSSVDSNGDWFDLSGLGHTLSYQGNPTYNYAGATPYWNLDGAGDYFNITDAASGNDFDILGTETYVSGAIRGLTYGGWYWLDLDTGNEMTLASKYDTAGNQRAYHMLVNTGTLALLGRISVDGIATHVATGPAVSLNAWHFAVHRFDPSSENAVFVDGTWYSNVAAVPASVFNSSADFMVGAALAGAARYLDGRNAVTVVCASAASDAMISAAFQVTRALFGV